MKPKTIIILALLLVIVVGLVAWAAVQQSAPSKLDGFAECLKDKGATFYGAFWCPHCIEQKKLFGTAKRLLPYVECSTPNGSGQRPVCADKNIVTYPTWRFAGDTEEIGGLTLVRLAEKTGCVLP
jgi:thiol-disulfide isomerase/thioredoxin